MFAKKLSWISAVALVAGACGISFGQVTGTVTLKGNPPVMQQIKLIQLIPDCAKQHKNPVYEQTVITGDKGQLANVVVSIKTPEGKKLGKVPTTPVVLDQKGCMYVPHVLPVMVGQPVDVKNSDSFLHNVHTLSIDNPGMNMAMIMVGNKKVPPFQTVETFKVKCDVHPWMVAWIRVLDNPYFATTSSDQKNIGQYSIDTKGLPDGEYTFVAWQEKYGTQEKKAKVTNGKATVDFTFNADEKAGHAAAAPAGAQAGAGH